MTIDILGTKYKVKFQSEKENKKLKGCNGLCEYYSKELIVENMKHLENDISAFNNIMDYQLGWFRPTQEQSSICYSMQVNDLTVVQSVSGSGKSSTAIWQSLNLVKQGKYVSPPPRLHPLAHDHTVDLQTCRF